MASTVKPTPIALVVCDSIYSDPSGKAALVGLFNNINVQTFPARHSRMAVFVSLTGLRDESTAQLKIVHSETHKPVLAAKGQFPNGTNPLMVVDLHFILNNVTFPEAGRYYIEFWSNDHLIVQRPFEVQEIAKNGKTNDNA